jgi:hypothetical protein
VSWDSKSYRPRTRQHGYRPDNVGRQATHANPAHRLMAHPARYIGVLMLVVVLGQRLAIPLGPGQQLPANLVLVLIVLGTGLMAGHLRLDPQLILLYLAGVGALLALTLVAVARGLDVSLLSVGFIGALYLLWAVETPWIAVADQVRLLDAFVRVMVVMAVVGLIQAGTQYLGVAYQDWLARIIPGPFLMQGYNTSDPILWNDPIYRTNGVLFLEPSLFSFFLGLALVVALHRRKPLPTIGLLLLAMLPTVAGNGFVVLLAGVGILAIHGRWRDLRSLLLPAGLAVAGSLTIPGAAKIVTRVTEAGTEGSSSSLRLIEPYTRLIPELFKDPTSVIFGNGAGSATTFVAKVGSAGLLAPVVPKLLFEYGVLGSVLFLIFLVTSLMTGSHQMPWTLGVLVAYFVLNAALEQPTFALVTILFVRLLSAGGADAVLSQRPVDLIRTRWG